MTVLGLLTQGDAVSRGVAALLLAMSVGSWVVIVWKGWLLRSGTRDVLRSVAAFWQSASLDEALEKLKAFDRSALVLPAVLAIKDMASGEMGATLGDRGQHTARLTRA
ncbi:MAG: MotA/TolQ/ExbB proton channel, partial [Variovorax sp.]|nr:MotA/TolQ/ExbB proton channel [Variovorax sp.]